MVKSAVEKLGVKVGLALLVLTIMISLAGSIMPTVQSSAQKLNESTLCNAQSGCFYNSTVSATLPCRGSANQSLVCTAGGDVAPAIFDLMDNNSAVIFTIVSVMLLFSAVFIAKGVAGSK